MLNPQTTNTMKFQFGEMKITPSVVNRLQELDFTVPELEDAVKEHISRLDDEPSIYCGTYAKYNEGSLRGLWIDISSFGDYDEFINFCNAIHADEDDPELMFQDYQGFPRELYSESCMGEADFDKIVEYKRMCDLHGAEAIDDFLELDHDIADFEEAYCGEWDSEEDFARHIVDECYDLERSMGSLSRYFDYEAFGRELFMYDYTMGANGNVFRNI